MAMPLYGRDKYQNKEVLAQFHDVNQKKLFERRWDHAARNSSTQNNLYHLYYV